jgi:hypothetical protein
MGEGEVCRISRHPFLSPLSSSPLSSSSSSVVVVVIKVRLAMLVTDEVAGAAEVQVDDDVGVGLVTGFAVQTRTGF